MQKTKYSVQINAPRQKVWETMLTQPTYSEWTVAFGGPSHFEGSWEQGSEIRFLSENKETGGTMGMYARIKDNRPYEFVSIEHLGFVNNGEVDTESEEAKKWTPAFENYTFTEVDGGTLLEVEVDLPPEHKPEMDQNWPTALNKLKELCES